MYVYEYTVNPILSPLEAYLFQPIEGGGGLNRDRGHSGEERPYLILQDACRVAVVRIKD